MYQLSVPSKTFLVGEYVALQGGPALVLNTEPRFQLMVTDRVPGTSTFHTQHTDLRRTENPYIQRILADNFFDSYDFGFQDPFYGRGGLGASSAQLVMLLGFKAWKLTGQWEISEILSCLRQFDGYRGSGYDAISQLTGGVSHIESGCEHYKATEWPWLDYEPILIRGPKKTVTHEHLAELKEKNLVTLHNISRETIKSYIDKNLEGFAKGISDFSEEQSRLGLLSSETQTAIETFKADSMVKVARGCGALGSDTLMLIVNRRRNPRWDLQLKEKHEVLPTLISRGLRVAQTRMMTGRPTVGLANLLMGLDR
ncbi:MAG: hypothetical protein AB7F59_11250 [Bdellovibrionales bacterium]